MTLDEAIKERQKVIEVQEKLYEEASTNESKEIIKSATDNDRQLAEWLKELKELREENKKAERLLLTDKEISNIQITWRTFSFPEIKSKLQELYHSDMSFLDLVSALYWDLIETKHKYCR